MFDHGLEQPKTNSGFLPWLEAMKKEFRIFCHG
jgi:hypothetical protein